MMKFVRVLLLFFTAWPVCAHAQVQLLYALPYYRHITNPVTGVETTFIDKTYFRVHAQNIGNATERTVFVHYDNGTTDWTNLNLGLEHDCGQHSVYTGALDDATVEFVIGYTTTNGTYWDHDDGDNYLIDPSGTSGDVGRIGESIGLAYAKRTLSPSSFKFMVTNYTTTVSGTILVQNLGYSKNVGVYITRDNWTTYEDVAASYAGTLSAVGTYFDIEYWTFSTSWSTNNYFSAHRATNLIAVYYEDVTGGSTYWDNNFTLDYKITATNNPIY